MILVFFEEAYDEREGGSIFQIMITLSAVVTSWSGFNFQSAQVYVIDVLF